MSFSVLDFIFPKRCVSCRKFGSYLCLDCFSKIEFIEHPVCSVCQRQAFEGKTHPGCRTKYSLDGLVVACRYRGLVKTAIIKVKYKWIWDIEQIFVDLLSERFWKFDLPKDIILIPVPLHDSRRRWRGFNQSEILAKSLGRKFKVPFANLLLRVRQTKPQVGLSKKQRKENVDGAFSIRSTRHSELDSESIRNKNFVIVDDVFTSGATIGECCRVLKKSGAKSVYAMCVALG